jgi:uncharacterized protein
MIYMDFVTALSTQFQLKPWQVQKVMELIDEGNTIPFIARYRKEAHGSLDDQALRQIADRLEYLRSLEKKKEEVARLIERVYDFGSVAGIGKSRDTLGN